MSMQTNYESHVADRLLFADNIKLLATNEVALECMVEETLRFFNVVGLETNRDKLQKVEVEKKRKYDVLANKLGADYGCPTKIIPDDNNMG